MKVVYNNLPRPTPHPTFNATGHE